MQKKPHLQPSLPISTSGFTLVELAIAVVIIGLIIGGVLVGGDMIRAANLKAGLKQIETYQAAINNFRMRYNGTPGDITDATSQFSTTTWPNLADGDGDGILRDDSGAESNAANYNLEYSHFTGELPQFW
ncbi:MAG: prepilin-type N-terminal cleavage/methylation domain-containing protein, partial [Alphaproteobacteria bacterium]|nr:prepilin-type N-terminal cleavage/methylation domain-containing protein [Alphaproteobacteria bacterium]